MKIKTSDLIDQALNWAAAKAVKPNYGDVRTHQANTGKWFVTIHGEAGNFQPSTNWAQGGPIIEREGILLRPVRKEGHKLNGQWLAMYDAGNTGSMVQWTDKFWFPRHYLTGPTPLIAAMRCYVASKLGDEVEIPKELQ